MITPICQINFGNGWETVPIPTNWKEGIRLQLSFLDEMPSSKLEGGDGFEFPNTTSYATASKINTYIDNGLNGGAGIGEALPMQLYLPPAPGTTNNIYLFQGGLDCTRIKRSCDKVVLPVKYINAIDWFKTFISGITFYALTQQGLASAGINISQWPGFSQYNALVGLPGSGAKYPYAQVPYVVTKEQDIFNAIMLILEEIGMVGLVKQALSSTVTDIKRIIADVTTAVTVLWSVPGIIGGIFDILGLIGQLAYDLFLGVALYGNTLTLLSNAGFMGKFKYGMKVTDIIGAAFDYMNNYGNVSIPGPLTFASSILNNPPYNNLIWLPKKTLKENTGDVVFGNLKNGGALTRGTEVNVPNTYGYPDEDMGTVWDAISKVFNAKGFLINGVVNFEEVHYTRTGSFVLKNVGKEGYMFNDPDDPFEYNYNELAWSYIKRWQLDSQDERTRIVYTGTTCQVITSRKKVNNPYYVMPPGGKDIVLPFALAKRKEYLNLMEQAIDDIVDVVADVFNPIITGINEILSYMGPILRLFSPDFKVPQINLIPKDPLNGIKGYLEVSQDTWNMPKLFVAHFINGLAYVDPNNGANNNNVWNNPNVPANTPFRGEGYMSAWALVNQFDGKNLPFFTPVDQNGNQLTPVNNQYKLYKKKIFPVCPPDFGGIVGNNVFTNFRGETVKLETGLYILDHEMVEEADYRIPFLYDKNLQTVVNIDGN